MKLQHYVYKIEELKALVALFEQTQQELARGTAVLDALGSEADAEELKKMEDTLATLRVRLNAVGGLLTDRTGTSDVDAAIDNVQAHMGRLAQYQQLRGEQVQLRTQLDLEMAIGEVEKDVRKNVEGQLTAMQQRMETLVQMGETSLVGPRLVTLA